jgi:hypothetical protein
MNWRVAAWWAGDNLLKPSPDRTVLVHPVRIK